MIVVPGVLILLALTQFSESVPAEPGSRVGRFWLLSGLGSLVFALAYGAAITMAPRLGGYGVGSFVTGNVAPMAIQQV